MADKQEVRRLEEMAYQLRTKLCKLCGSGIALIQSTSFRQLSGKHSYGR